MGLNANWTRLLLHFWWFSFIKLATQLLKTLLFTSRIWLLLHFISIFSSMCYATWATIPLGDFPSSLSQGKSSIIFLWLLSNRGATNHKMDGLNTLLRLLYFASTKIFRHNNNFILFFRHWKYFLKTIFFKKKKSKLEWHAEIDLENLTGAMFFSMGETSENIKSHGSQTFNIPIWG